MISRIACGAIAFVAFHATAGELVVPAGTTFYGTVTKEISTKDLAEGQPVRDSAQVREPLIVNGETVLPAGTEIQLLVSELKKGRRARIGDEVTLTAMSAVAVDGSTINLSGPFNAKEDTKVAKDVGFGIVTPWTLLKKGSAATIPEGRVFGITIPAEIRVRIPDRK